MSSQDNEKVNEPNDLAKPENREESGSVQEERSENPEPSADERDVKLAELKAKVDELNDRYLRLYSEFDNFRKRTAKEKVELIQSGGADVFKSILPVIDDFERAIKSNSETSDVKAVNDGVNLIYNKLKSTLNQKGLEEMKSVGEPFDSEIHEAITSAPAPSEDLKGKVIEELEKGYTLNGKIIRFAKVVTGQ